MSICKFFYTFESHLNNAPSDFTLGVIFYNISCVESLNVVDDKNAIFARFYAI